MLTFNNRINIKSEQLIETKLPNSHQNSYNTNLHKYANQQIQWRQRAKAELIVCIHHKFYIHSRYSFPYYLISCKHSICLNLDLQSLFSFQTISTIHYWLNLYLSCTKSVKIIKPLYLMQNKYLHKYLYSYIYTTINTQTHRIHHEQTWPKDYHILYVK